MLSHFDATYPAYPILAFLSAALVLIPLPWHLQAWNAGTCLFMVWTAIACLNLGINSIVWVNDIIDRAPIFCDISSRTIIAVSVAIPAASLCIQRRLYSIATMQTVTITRAEKRKGIIIDLAIGVGIPLLQVLCQYVVSGHRYDIYEGIGCSPYTYNTPPAYALTFGWPIAISVVSAGYCVLTFAAFLRRRAQFNSYLAANSSLTANRYFRLMALASIELLVTVPISAYGLYLNLSAAPMNPWISWEDTHFEYWRVQRVPALLWRTDKTMVISFELSRWLAPFCGLVFFAFFGFAQEARNHYRDAFLWLRNLPPFRRWAPTPAGRQGSAKSMKAAGWTPSFKYSADTLPAYSSHAPQIPPLSSVSTTSTDSSFPTTPLSAIEPFSDPEKGYVYAPSSPSDSTMSRTSSDLSFPRAV